MASVVMSVGRFSWLEQAMMRSTKNAHNIDRRVIADIFEKERKMVMRDIMLHIKDTVKETDIELKELCDEYYEMFTRKSVPLWDDVMIALTRATRTVAFITPSGVLIGEVLQHALIYSFTKNTFRLRVSDMLEDTFYTKKIACNLMNAMLDEWHDLKEDMTRTQEELDIAWGCLFEY